MQRSQALKNIIPRSAINGTFADVIKASVIPMPAGKKVEPKKDKPKKK